MTRNSLLHSSTTTPSSLTSNKWQVLITLQPTHLCVKLCHRLIKHISYHDGLITLSLTTNYTNSRLGAAATDFRDPCIIPWRHCYQFLPLICWLPKPPDYNWPTISEFGFIQKGANFFLRKYLQREWCFLTERRNYSLLFQSIFCQETMLLYPCIKGYKEHTRFTDPC